MLVVDPDKRLSIKSILTHKWMTSCDPVLISDTGTMSDIVNLNPMVLEHMLTLPGLDEEMICNVCSLLHFWQVQ